MNDEILLLSPRDIRALLIMDDCIAAVEEAFRLHGEDKAYPPAVASLHARDGGFHVKAGLLDLNRAYFAAKVNGNFPENPRRFGLPTIQGVIVLCDADKGYPLAVMDSRDITALRTAAATAVAAKYLARPNSDILTICGCGNQGRVQLQALSRVYRLTRVFAYDIDPVRASHFSSGMSEDLNFPVMPVSDLSAAVRQSDVCVTCTPSHEPLLRPDEVAPGLFIAAVGADNPVKQEIHPALMAKSKVVADVLEQCVAMGDLHHAIEAGLLNCSEVHAELGEIVAGKRPGRESDSEVIVFDSTGMALQDVAAAALVYENAIGRGVGARFSLAA